MLYQSRNVKLYNLYLYCCYITYIVVTGILYLLYSRYISCSSLCMSSVIFVLSVLNKSSPLLYTFNRHQCSIIFRTINIFILPLSISSMHWCIYWEYCIYLYVALMLVHDMFCCIKVCSGYLIGPRGPGLAGTCRTEPGRVFLKYWI